MFRSKKQQPAPPRPVARSVPSPVAPPAPTARTAPASLTGATTARRQPPFNTPRFAVLDVETTGLSPTSHRIVEVALVTTDIHGRIVEEWTTRLNPQGPIGATHIHGISAADVANAPVFGDVVDSIMSRLDGAAVAAHNAKFDLAFLRAELARAGWRMPFVPALCTLEASDHHLPHLERRRLADCCWAIGQPLTNAHSALFDARAAAGLLAAYMHPHVGPAARPGDMGLPAEGWAVVWPTSPEEGPVDLPGAGTRRRSTAEVARVRHKTATSPASAPLVQLVERFSLTDALDEGAPLNVAGASAYLEKVAEVLEDGVLTKAEAADLSEVAVVQALSPTERESGVAGRSGAVAPDPVHGTGSRKTWSRHPTDAELVRRTAVG